MFVPDSSDCKFKNMASNRDSLDDFMVAAACSYKRFETNFDRICEKVHMHADTNYYVLLFHLF